MTGFLDLSPGSVFAQDYRIERLLARGGMGAVYVARQLSTDRDRALKLMHPMLAADEAMRRRFEQEAKIGSRIRSSHVVEVIAAGIDARTGMPWLAMELLEGQDLASYMALRGALSLAETEQILSQLCHGLAAAHAVNVVHRDLKPENVFLSRTQQQGSPLLVKLLDLGIAKLVAEAHPRETAAVGTPLWMAPEQTGKSVAPSADVWALGLLAFWMLSGRYYWSSANSQDSEPSLMDLLREIATDSLEPASRRAAAFGRTQTFPAGFDGWFARCVTRDPAARFANAAEAHAAFAGLLTGTADTVQLPSSALAELDASAKRASAPPIGTAASSTGTTAELSAASATQSSRRLIFGLGLLVAVVGGAALLRREPSAPQRAAATHAAVTPTTRAPGVSLAAKTPAPSDSARVEPRNEADATDPKIVWNVPIGDSPQRGAADALVTIVEYGNFQCPYSKGVEPALRKILDDYAGKIRLVWKDDPLAVHSQAEVSATVAREARAQRGDAGFWAAHDLFLDRSFKPNVGTLLASAKKLNLELPRVEKAIADRAFAGPIAADADTADELAVVGTPYFFVNGRRAIATQALDKLRGVVEEELQHAETLLASGTPRSAIYDSITHAGRSALPLEIKPFPLKSVTEPTRGGSATSATLLEFCGFGNFLCKLVDNMVDDLLQTFPDQLGVVWLDVPEGSNGDSQRASMAARAAYRFGGVDGFDRMRRLLFTAQGKPDGFSGWALGQYADSIGLPRSDFKAGLQDPETAVAIERDAEMAKNSGLGSVPGFLVCGPDFCNSGGYFLTGAQPRRAFEKRVRLVIAANGGPLPLVPR